MSCGHTILALSLAVSLTYHLIILMGKTQENDKMRHNMTQIASVLAVFILISGLQYLLREGLCAR